MNARDEVLKRIRSALGSARAGADGHEGVGAPAGWAGGPLQGDRGAGGPAGDGGGRFEGGRGADMLASDGGAAGGVCPGGDGGGGAGARAGTATGDRVRLFLERVGNYRADVAAVPAGQLGEALAGALRGVRTLVIPAGFDPTWASLVPDVTRVADHPPLTARELDAVDGVLTSCALAIAETGTIVLDGGPGQGRRSLTLVPDLHVCVIGTDQIVASVPDALVRLDPRRPLTFVSGPSATSDIELARVEGVHGPRTLRVVVVVPTD